MQQQRLQQQQQQLQQMLQQQQPQQLQQQLQQLQQQLQPPQQETQQQRANRLHQLGLLYGVPPRTQPSSSAHIPPQAMPEQQPPEPWPLPPQQQLPPPPSPSMTPGIDWNDPQCIQAEREIFKALQVRMRDRGPPPSSEGGPQTWKGQVWREGSQRWGNRGGKRVAEWTAFFREQRHRGEGDGDGGGGGASSSSFLGPFQGDSRT